MDTDPHRTGALAGGPTPEAGGSTLEQFKADITTGKNKGQVMDSEHGLSRLGTDDEAGGHPNSPELIDQMRQLETPSDGKRNEAAPGRHDAAPRSSRLGLMLTIAGVLALIVLWFALTQGGGT